MAVNESDDGGMNEADGGSPEQAGASPIGQLDRFARYAKNKKSVREQDLERRLEIAVSSMAEAAQRGAAAKAILADPNLIASGAQDTFKKVNGETTAKFTQQMQNTLQEAQSSGLSGMMSSSSINKQIDLLRTSKIERYNEQASNMMGRVFSPSSINGEVSAAMRDQEVQREGARQASQGWSSIQEKKRGVNERLSQLGGDSREAALAHINNQGDVDPHYRGQLESNVQEKDSLVKQLIELTAGEKHLKDRGEDPESKMRAQYRTGDKAEEYLSKQGLRQDISSGKNEYGRMTAGKLDEKQADAAKRLTEALSELGKTSKDATEKIAELEEAAGKAQKEYEDIDKARAAGAGGGGGSKYAAGAAWGSLIANAANVIGNTIQTMAIDQPLQKVQNMTGLANVENYKYDTWRSAIEGDMGARLRLGGMGNVQEFGQQLHDRAKWVVGARIGAGAFTTGAGVLKTADAVTNIPGGETVSKAMGKSDVVNDVGGGLQTMLEGGSQTLTAGKDWVDDLSTNVARIQGNMAMIGFNEASSHISGRQLQESRNHFMGMGAATMNMGQKGEGFLNETAGSGYVQRMIDVGLDPRTAAKMAQFGSSQMGSTFSSNDMIMAKTYQNLGMGSAEENLQRQSIFSNAGSQNPAESLGRVMMQSVAQGFDQSKQLTLVAEHTGALVEKSKLAGSAFDVSDVAAKRLMASVDSNDPNKEGALRRQMGASQSIDNMLTDRSSTLFNQMALKRNMGRLDIDLASSTALHGVSPATKAKWQKELQAGNKDAVLMDMAQHGVDARKSKVMNDPKAFGNIMMENLTLQELEGGAGGAGVLTGAVDAAARLKEYFKKNPNMKKLIRGGDVNAFKNAPEQVHQDLLAINRVATIGGAANGQGGDFTADVFEKMGILDAATPGAIPNEKDRRAGAATNSFIQENDAGGVQMSRANQSVMEKYGLTTGADVGLFNRMTGETAQKSAGPNGEKAFADSMNNLGKAGVDLTQASGQLVDAAKAMQESAGVNKLVKENFEEMNKNIKMMNDKMSSMSDTFNKLPGMPSMPTPVMVPGAQPVRVDGGSP